MHRTGSVASAETPTKLINCANTGYQITGTCSNIFDGATSVTLTATPDPLMLFTGWTGPCSTTTVAQTGGTCVISSVDAAKQITATFEIDPLLTVYIAATSGSNVITSSSGGVTINCVSNNANGTTGSCTGHYILDQLVTLTATNNSAYPTWSVSPGTSISSGCTAVSQTCTVKMSVDTTVTAVYQGTPVTVNIDAASTGTGAVSSGEATPKISNCGGLLSPVCTYVYTSSTAVTLTQTADAGSTFTG